MKEETQEKEETLCRHDSTQEEIWQGKYGRGKGCRMISPWRSYKGSGKVGAGYGQLGMMALESPSAQEACHPIALISTMATSE